MKTNIYAFSKVLLLGLLAIQLSAAGSKEAPSLQVKIETPTVIDLLRESDIHDAFLSQIDTAFRRSGFEGRIVEIDDVDTAADDIPLLQLRLIDWERGHTGQVECRFTAELTTLDGRTTPLGSFNGRAMSWGRNDRFTLSKAFEDAAIDAIRDLYRDIDKLNTASADKRHAR